MSGTEPTTSADAIASLKADHKKVKELFETLEGTQDRRTKKAVVTEALEELGIHATLGGNGAQTVGSAPPYNLGQPKSVTWRGGREHRE